MGLWAKERMNFVVFIMKRNTARVLKGREGIIEVLGVGVGETVSAVAPEIWRLCLIYCGADIVCHL